MASAIKKWAKSKTARGQQTTAIDEGVRVGLKGKGPIDTSEIDAQREAERPDLVEKRRKEKLAAMLEAYASKTAAIRAKS